MKTHVPFFIAFILLYCQLAIAVPGAGKQRQYAGRPLCFVANKGQITDQDGNARNDIQYRTGSGGVNVFVGCGALHYQFSKAIQRKHVPRKDEVIDLKERDTTQRLYSMYRLDMELVGANKDAVAVAADTQAYYEHYHTAALQGKDATAAAYGRVTYKDIYPNIDWTLYIKDGRLEYDFIVRPGGDASDIKIRYGGATDIAHAAGHIQVSTPLGDVNEEKLYAYEQGTGKAVPAAFTYRHSTIGFSLEGHARHTTYVIDPELAWGSYFGGNGEDEAFGTGCDRLGNAYIIGRTTSTSNIATTGAYQTVYAGDEDAFLAKFTPVGGLAWATYFGGDKDDMGYGVACDSLNNVYITGTTLSESGIATAGSFYTSNPDGQATFLAAFSATGTLNWSTYYGALTDGRGITSDGKYIYITGYAQDSGHLATPGCFQDSLVGESDIYLAKFDSAGMIQWGTFYGTGNDAAFAVACDKQGNVYLGGSTLSDSGLATPGCYQDTSGGGTDCIIAKFTSAGNRLWSTYYGGSLGERVLGMVCDSSNNIYATGFTFSPNGIATPGSYQDVFNYAYNDVFLVKFNDAGAIQWGTYYGGGGDNESGGVSSDGYTVYIAGFTISPDSIATPGAYDTVNSGGDDAFLARFDSAGHILWATYYGGTNNDGAYGVACDVIGNVYIAGATASNNDIGTHGVYESSFNDSTDAFIAKFDTATTSNVVAVVKKTPLQISLYPSPNNGSFTINGNVGIADHAQIEIINAAGQVIYSATAKAQDGLVHEKTHINTGPGLYLLRINTDDNTASIPFIIQ